MTRSRPPKPALGIPGKGPGRALVEAVDLHKSFPLGGGLLSRTRARVRAVQGVSFTIPSGRIVGLVGESGSGKTTVGRLLLRLIKPSSGLVRFEGTDLSGLDRGGEDPAGFQLFDGRKLVRGDGVNDLDLVVGQGGDPGRDLGDDLDGQLGQGRPTAVPLVKGFELHQFLGPVFDQTVGSGADGLLAEGLETHLLEVVLGNDGRGHVGQEVDQNRVRFLGDHPDGQVILDLDPVDVGKLGFCPSVFGIRSQNPFKGEPDVLGGQGLTVVEGQAGTKLELEGKVVQPLPGPGQAGLEDVAGTLLVGGHVPVDQGVEHLDAEGEAHVGQGDGRVQGRPEGLHGQLYNPDRPRFAYDPDKAKKLLKESGYQGQELIFTTHPVYYTNGLAAAQAVTEMWRRIGARIKLKVDENWYANSLKDESIAIRNISDWLVIADPHVTILWSWAVSSQWTGNDRFKELGQKAMSTLETGKRLEIYQQMLDMFEEEAPGTVLYRAQEFYGVKKNLDWQPYMYFMEFRPGHIKIN